MARGAAKQRQRTTTPKPPAARRAPKRSQPKSIEDTMFFPRLRNHAKWVFVFLALVFAVGFVGFGVGSGSTGIGDALRGNFNFFGGSKSPAEKNADKARDRLKKHPDDAKAWAHLANALTQQNKPTKANAAWEHYVKLRPKDADALFRIATYYQGRGGKLVDKARAEQAEAPPGVGPAGIVAPSGPLANAFGQDPISQQFTQQSTKDFGDAQKSYEKSRSAFKRGLAIRPDDQNMQFQLGEVALLLGDRGTAVKAYRAAIKIAPDSAIATIAKQRLAALSGVGGPGGSGG
jgi:tetratricopeptide (TPR) repeat protein